MIAKKGDKVKVEYEGKFEDEVVFDSSKHGDHSHPLEFEIGAGHVVPGFDFAIKGMKKGEEKEFTLEKDDAYGDYREDLKKEVPRNLLPKEQEPKEGMILMLGTPDGRQFPAKITKVS